MFQPAPIPWVGGKAAVAVGMAVMLLGLPAASSAASVSRVVGVEAAAPRPAPVFGRAQAAADRPDPVSRSLVSDGSIAPIPTGTWQALGPAPIGPPYLSNGGFYGGANSGRITALVSIPSGLHAGRAVVGTAGGGIWTTDDNGATYTPRSDFATDLAIGALAIDPSNANHLIAGTGEANQCGDCFAGAGILVSTDGGTTWTLQNPGAVFSGRFIAKVAIDPSNPNHQFAATDRGLYITTNAGTSWAKPTDPSYAAVDGNVTAVVINPTTPTIVYIGGGAKTVAESIDGGIHWAAASSGIATPGASPLTALALAPSSPATLFASVGSVNAVALYKSTTGGAGWSHLTTAPDYTGQGYSYGSGSSEQGWYDNVVEVDPANANHVLAGGITLVATSDGGTSWTNVNGGPFFFNTGPNKIHPDQHALAFRADGKVWVGDDGGVFLYTPSTGAVANVNGHLNITQFYYGFNVVGDMLVAGAQDNSSARTGSPSLATWTGIFGGDGGPSAITSNHTQTQFIESNGSLYVTTDSFATTLSRINPPRLGLFTPPMVVVSSTATPSNPTVFYGGPDLYRTTNPTTGATWTQVTSVGQYVSAIAASATNPQVIYVGFTNGTIEVSTNGGLSFSQLAVAPTSQHFVTGLSVDPANPKAITASFSYNDTRYFPGLPHVAQYIYTTAPGTGTWTVITGNLPLAAVSRVVYDNGALIAGTDIGVYGTTTPAGSSTSWTLVGVGLPSVQVQDLFVQSRGLYIVTHGRGAWKLPASADVAVQKTGPSSVAKGANATYTITVTNLGPSIAASVKLTDVVPTGTTFVSESQTAGPAFKCTNPPAGGTGTTSCTLSLLNPGASAVFTLIYNVPSNATLTSISNTAKVSSPTPDPVTANNTSTVVTQVS